MAKNHIQFLQIRFELHLCGFEILVKSHFWKSVSSLIEFLSHASDAT